MFRNKYYLCIAALLVVAIAGTAVYGAMHFTPKLTKLMPGMMLQTVGLNVDSFQSDDSAAFESVTENRGETSERSDIATPENETKKEKSEGSAKADNSVDDNAIARPYLGLHVTKLHPALIAQIPGLESGKSRVIVDKVIKDAPAHLAGVKRHDIITHFNDQPVESPRQLANFVLESKPGDAATLSYLRKGDSFNVVVSFKAMPRNQNPLAGYPAWFPPLKPFDFEDEFPAFDFPDFSSSDVGAVFDAKSWSEFQSMKMTRNTEGEYRIDIEYRRNGDSIERTFEGTREEILKAIKDDSELPESIRKRVRGRLAGEQAKSDRLAETLLDDFNRPWFNSDWFNDRDWFRNHSLFHTGDLNVPAIDRSNDDDEESNLGL